jgi:hypothetical protein
MSEQAAQAPSIDKSAWGDGPWQDEPDRVDFVHAGFACFANRRGDGLGFFCGYVGVPREHPAYGKNYNDVDVEVHGGLTYANPCDGEICHVPESGMPDDVWWLGFDCGHAGDLGPGLRATLRRLEVPETCSIFRDEYRDLAYVRRQIEQLAEQLRAIAEASPKP